MLLRHKHDLARLLSQTDINAQIMSRCKIALPVADHYNF